ncbi:MAG: hypothetical protein M0R17_05470 [Candidatus Omnitrophica bacterium]|jgi:hypothetical protein|nr:hypothetical protein [Candidatus Omnitrophota bacterium]
MAYNISISGNVYQVDHVNLTGSLVSIVFPDGFENNKQYEVTLSNNISGEFNSSNYYLENGYSFWFTSTYCPLFTTVKKIHLTGGPQTEMFLDDTINKMIHKNSIDAVDLYNLYNNTSVAYDYWGCTASGVPTILRRYVECKTAYDLISLLKMSGSSNEQLKTLGDLTIKYDTNSNASKDDPNRLKELYDCWKTSLNTFGNIKSTVRGFYDQSKQFRHPVLEPAYNRVKQPVYPIQRNYSPGTIGVRGF